MKIAVLVATGFEDTELITTINVFERNGIDYDLISVENLEIVTGQNEAMVKTTKFSDFKQDSYEGLFLPGGKGHKILLEDERVISLVQEYNTKDKWIFAICAAPEILTKAGIVSDKRITSFKGYAKNGNNTGREIEVYGKVITGRDFHATLTFARAIIETLKK